MEDEPMFFRDLKLDLYPISSIKRMTRRNPSSKASNVGEYDVILNDETNCRVSNLEATNLLRLSWKYVPAYPGVVLLELKDSHSDNDPFHRTGVLAWAIDEDGGLQAVTGEGISGVKRWAVLTPDGLISDRFGATFANEEAYIAALNEDES